MVNPIDVVIISGVITLVGTILSWFLGRLTEARKHKQVSSTPGAPTVQEIWQRQDKMETAFRSALVLLGEVAEQWDGPHPPVLSKRHVAVLAEGGYLPPEFDNIHVE